MSKLYSRHNTEKINGCVEKAISYPFLADDLITSNDTEARVK